MSRRNLSAISSALAFFLTSLLAAETSETAFQLDPGETAVVSRDLSQDSSGWEYRDATIQDGELLALPDTRWAQATLRLDEPDLDLPQAIWTFYWACRTDGKKGEDASALNIKLWVTDEPEREEQISVNAIVRATLGWQMLYVDPGFMMEHTQEMRLRPERNEFPDAQTVRKYRIRITPVAQGQLTAELHLYDDAKSTWTAYEDYHTDSPAEPMPIDIAADLEGHATIKALDFMFPGPAASVTAVALTRKPHPGVAP